MLLLLSNTREPLDFNGVCEMSNAGQNESYVEKHVDEELHVPRGERKHSRGIQ